MAEDTQTPDGRPNFPKMEEEMAAYWDKKNIFERSVEERPESKTFVFYDGPPFATGLPHYGHLLQSVVKDVIPRYKTMQGFRVPRRWGWDCHGLPVEHLVEKDLNLASKRELEAYGVEGFTQACRLSVFRYVKEWDRYIRRLGRWVDMKRAYRTVDDAYIESVWWVFSELFKKGYVYKDRRVSLYCPRCATPLSNFEVGMGDSYAEHDDPAVTVKFPVKGRAQTYLLAWTTTPWTLPANVALAVHPELIYVTVKIHNTGETLTFAEARMNDVLREFFPLDDQIRATEHDHKSFEILERHTGEELEGIEYEPLYSFLPVGDYRHHVVTAGYVSAEDGTGIVHTAPAFGEEDMLTAKAHALPVLETVDEEGRLVAAVLPWAGLEVRSADAPILEDLQSRGLLYRRETVGHSVPVCWRCASLLIYRAQPAWYVNVTKLKPKLLETAKRINWHPAHFKAGRFGKGIESAPDWNISRTRYWGAPIPVWECELCSERVVVASLAELKQRATPESFPATLDLHRPGIDRVALSCACGGLMRRVPEVFDCWFESGSMPYAAEHYPFEHKARFDKSFPADFIGEAQDQTRGWFHVLHVLAAALMGKPAFKDAVVTGMILAEDGKKMSKSLKNYPDPWDVLATYGADALRLYFLSSPVIESESMNFSARELDEVSRKLLSTLWNVAEFYRTYAGQESVELAKPRSAHVLDRWLYARLHALMRDVTLAYERYELTRAVRPLREFVDDLSTWWLRRSRDRLRSRTNDYDRRDAQKTLREVLLDLAAVMAPAAPFIADRLYLDLGGPKASVHLDRWPKTDERLIDERLLADMAWVREAAAAGQEQRASLKIPVRQALAQATVFVADPANVGRLGAKSDLLDLLRAELNVESISLQAGKDADTVRVELDTLLTPELKEKGMRRELARRFMSLRKARGLKPADSITACVAARDQGLRDTLDRLAESLALDVHASSLHVGADLPPRCGAGKSVSSFTLDGREIEIAIEE